MKKYLKKIPKEIIGFILIVIIAILAIKVDSNSFKQNSTIDTCFAEPSSLTGAVRYVFYNDSIKYVEVKRGKVDVVFGERFLIEYDSTKPMNAKPLLHKPVFKKSELVDTVVGVVSEKYKKSYIFNYDVNEIKYQKRGYFDKRMSKSIKINSVYKVVYWLKNPKRAILLFKESDSDQHSM